MLLALTLAATLALSPPSELKAGELGVRLEIASRGTVLIKLYTKEAPRTTTRIQELVRQGFYDNQRFFRVERDPRPFLVQIGDPASKTRPMDDPKMGSGGTGVTIPFEDSGMSNVQGAVGLSTLPDKRDTGDCQFYILLAPAKFLDGKYTVFGQVIQGMDVVESLAIGDRVARASLIKGE